MTKSACMWLGLSLALASVGAEAQTVIGGGTMNTVPVFTGTSTVGNSPISVSGNNVGIGTPAPLKLLSLGNGSGATFGLSGIDGTSYNFDLDSSLGNYLQIMSEQPGHFRS
jgi:hypothetical protein